MGGGGDLYHVSVLTSLLVESDFFLNWNLRYLSWVAQYQTEKLVLLMQCYYYVNTGTFH